MRTITITARVMAKTTTAVVAGVIVAAVGCAAAARWVLDGDTATTVLAAGAIQAVVVIVASFMALGMARWIRHNERLILVAGPLDDDHELIALRLSAASARDLNEHATACGWDIPEVVGRSVKLHRHLHEGYDGDDPIVRVLLDDRLSRS